MKQFTAASSHIHVVKLETPAWRTAATPWLPLMDVAMVTVLLEHFFCASLQFVIKPS